VRQVRPHIVTLIALFQFFRASVLLLMALGTWAFPDLHLDSRAEAPYPAIVRLFVAVLIAVFYTATGIGLWRLKKWARNILMVGSGMNVVLWLRGFALEWWVSSLPRRVTPHDESGWQLVLAVIFTDLMIFCCLWLYPDVPEAFNRKDES
jgi:hypothetical protein